MSFDISLCMMPAQRMVLSPSQKLELRQMLLQLDALRDPAFEAVRGLEGIHIADQTLREKNTAGVLIGGLAEVVWNRQRKKETLASHKDVDVAVLSDVHFAPFERGVDWWLPQKASLSVQYTGGEARNIDVQWHKNGNDVILHCDITQKYPLDPGLYIFNPDHVVEMRYAEVITSMNFSGGLFEYDFDVEDAFRDKLYARMRTRVPPFLERLLPGRILSWDYESSANRESIGINAIAPEMLRAIYAYEGITPQVRTQASAEDDQKHQSE